MRTADFSRGPRHARAEVVFIGANHYRSPLALLQQLAMWPRIVRELKASDGYLWHRSYWQFPLVIGLAVGFRDRSSLLRYARQDEHRRAMHWSTDEGHTNAGFIRMFNASPRGYANGVWRAEEPEMRHIERFTAVRDEAVGPLVNPSDADGRDAIG